MKEYHVIMTKRRMLERIEQYKETATEAVTAMLTKMSNTVSSTANDTFFYLPRKFEEVAFSTVDDEVDFIYHNLAQGGNNRADEAVPMAF